ncbi:MAG TPA: NAD+ synthase, partial [Xanthomonadales bacterium]|nr:NAD+ synthase [Xanthomonadales bacterium]
MKLALAQRDFLVGDITANTRHAIDCIEQAKASGASLILFPELALTGYPPEDLLLRPGFMRRSHEAVEALVRAVQGIDVVIGHPWEQSGSRFNAASWIRNGELAGRYFKQVLPNYAVFDERRYFTPGDQPLVVELDGVRFGVVICEDTWEPGPARQAAAAGAQCLLAPNASPYRDDKLVARAGMLARVHEETGLAMAYCNLVGGQDELVFDGRSMLLDADGQVSGTGPLCEEALLLAEFDPGRGGFTVLDWPPGGEGGAAEIYAVLVRGTRDYLRKNGFSDAVLGLSGGVDSALTLAVAVDALGAGRVHAVMMPSRHTSELSLQLAREQAKLLGVDYRSIDIEAAFASLSEALAPAFEGVPPDVTEENLQARIRGTIVMALSNKFGWLLLATSNKSELAVGYSTIYGDMCGGFSPLKDCLKTRVFELCRYRNSVSRAIPDAVLERAPSAELAPGQSDQDSLPPYAELDEMLRRFVDLDQTIAEIIAAGFDEPVVRRVA